MAAQVTRRNFLQSAAAFVFAVGVTACPRGGGGPLPPMGQGVIVFKRSSRGRRVSNAEKKHNANHLYRTELDALNDLPHDAANGKVVKLTISKAKFNELFFHPGICCVDLRTV